MADGGADDALSSMGGSSGDTGGALTSGAGDGSAAATADSATPYPTSQDPQKDPYFGNFTASDSAGPSSSAGSGGFWDDTKKALTKLGGALSKLDTSKLGQQGSKIPYVTAQLPHSAGFVQSQHGQGQSSGLSALVQQEAQRRAALYPGASQQQTRGLLG